MLIMCSPTKLGGESTMPSVHQGLRTSHQMAQVIRRTFLPTLPTCLLAPVDQQEQLQLENANSLTQKVYSQMYLTM